MKKTTATALLLVCSVTLFAGCDTKKYFFSTEDVPKVPQNSQSAPSQSSEPPVTSPAGTEPSGPPTQPQPQPTPQSGDKQTKQVNTNPESVSALVNKQYPLPEGYVPSDLVRDPEIPFAVQGSAESQMMRQETAQAVKKMFAAAKQDGIHLAGVSAYRSHATQTALFHAYVQQDGLEKAKTYSAVPGTSEHETGLAIDVSGIDGSCAADDCFGGTPEANWLAAHAQEYGFIVRYPQGKEQITGYQYEPWHLRYVGVKVAQDVVTKGITLEEYYSAN